MVAVRARVRVRVRARVKEYLGFAPPPSSPEPQEVPSANMASPGGPAAQAAAAALANALGVVARWSVGLGIAGSVAQASLFDVDGGERAVMFNRLSGVSQKVVGEGTVRSWKKVLGVIFALFFLLCVILELV